MNILNFPTAGLAFYPDFDGLVVEFKTDAGIDYRMLSLNDAIDLSIRLPEMIAKMKDYETELSRRAHDDSTSDS